MTKTQKKLVRKIYHRDIELELDEESPVKAYIKRNWDDIKTVASITLTAYVFAVVMTVIMPKVLFGQ